MTNFDPLSRHKPELLRIGVIREGKTPPDERVPITPEQMSLIAAAHPQVRFCVEPSPVRRITDAEYSAVNIPISQDLRDCDMLIGVKEVPVDQLIPDKTYFFFSHTIKKQPYNKKLLQAVVDKRITLIDWECLRDAKGRRVIGFGRYAGIVGTFNGFRAYGLREKRYALKKAHDCVDRAEMEGELKKVDLPPVRILLTGRGKVAKGSMEVLDLMGIRKVGKREYLNQQFDEPVYCQITFTDYFKRQDGKEFDVQDFYRHPEEHRSDFMRFARVTDMYFAGHFWGSGSPFLFTREDARHPDFKIRYVNDISCDVDGPVASTIRASTIEAPFYGYDPFEEAEVPFQSPEAICVMAVDNLPCELPRDASHEFGDMFTHHVLPSLLNGDKHDILKNGAITHRGVITDQYAYLRDWLAS